MILGFGVGLVAQIVISSALQLLHMAGCWFAISLLVLLMDNIWLAKKLQRIYIYNVHYFFVICCMYVVYTASIVEGVI